MKTFLHREPFDIKFTSHTNDSLETSSRIQVFNQAKTDRRPLNTSFLGQPGKAGNRKVKPIWILVKQEMIGWQWHQLDHM